MSGVTESTVEEAALAWLENLGWNVAHGPDIAPDTTGAERADYGQVILVQRVRDALARLNSDLSAETLDDAFRRLVHSEGPTLEACNRAFHHMIVDGITVEYRASDGAVRGAQASVLDFEDPDNNDWLAVNQFTVVENKNERRPDIVLFVNGLPLGVIELKNPAADEATIWTAWQQLQTYKAELPTLFAMNAALIVSDDVNARIGTLTSRAGVVQALAHDRRRDPGHSAPVPAAGDAGGRLRAEPVPRAGPAISSSSRMTGADRWSRRWPATTSFMQSRWRSPRPCGRPS